MTTRKVKLIGTWEGNEIPPKEEDCIRFVCLSDTHANHFHIKSIPDGDVLLHAGDFTLSAEKDEMISFDQFLSKQPHKHKIVVLGNHDTNSHSLLMDVRVMKMFKRVLTEEEQPDIINPSDYITHCKILKVDFTVSLLTFQNEPITVEGITIHGVPWVNPVCDAGIWDTLVKDGSKMDILLAHGPPFGEVGGRCKNGRDAGSRGMQRAVSQLKPAVVVFGHIHESYGVYKDEHTTYVNAAICDEEMKASHNPIVFDISVHKMNTFNSSIYIKRLF